MAISARSANAFASAASRRAADTIPLACPAPGVARPSPSGTAHGKSVLGADAQGLWQSRHARRERRWPCGAVRPHGRSVDRPVPPTGRGSHRRQFAQQVQIGDPAWSYVISLVWRFQPRLFFYQSTRQRRGRRRFQGRQVRPVPRESHQPMAEARIQVRIEVAR